jgi:hypothetical protein
VAAFKRELTRYEFNGKGSIRFPLDKPVPAALIEHMATFLMKDVARARAETKTAKPRIASRQSPLKPDDTVADGVGQTKAGAAAWPPLRA